MARSIRDECTVMNVDVGGGTSKIAVCTDGKVTDVTALDVPGDRLLDPPLQQGVGGVRHLALGPDSVHVTPDGQVLVTGLGTDAALRGSADPDADPLAADRRDALENIKRKVPAARKSLGGGGGSIVGGKSFCRGPGPL